MSNKVVIFDMDGVLVDTEPVYRRLSEELYKRLGIELTEEEQYAFAGSVSKDKWTSLRNRFNLKQSIEELGKMSSGIKYEYLANKENEIPKIKGIDELILSLKDRGIKICVASSSRKENVEVILAKTKLIKYFDYIISGSEVQKGKPNPEIFLKAADKLNADITDCVVIEDTRNGVRAAKAAKMKCVGFRNLNSGIQNIEASDIIVDAFDKENIKDIIKFVEE
ncbi:HAD family hydrolase [Clostridium felsineum]|uniref:HAD family hydrolase n=1 Tax=Clostridium felsineum TaxID=36839 RepID=UPI00098C397A|nr:HAD family phosphatase [Clostridium felsineum]URZ18420.1 Phosphorylated carbohydrates phosphatase [Clostridium felsineum DSM 794]